MSRRTYPYDTNGITWTQCEAEGCGTEIQKSDPDEYCGRHSPDDNQQMMLGEVVE